MHNCDNSYKKYADIKNISPYDLTESIAWEMAIRNKNVKQIIEELSSIRKQIQKNYVYSNQFSTITEVSSDINNNDTIEIDILNYISKEPLLFKKEREDLELKLNNAQLNESLGFYAKKDILKLINILDEYENIYYKLFDSLKPNEVVSSESYIISQKKLPELSLLSKSFFMLYQSLKEEYFIDYIHYIHQDDLELNKIANIKSRLRKMDRKSGKNLLHVITQSNQTISTLLFPEQSRPHLTVPDKLSKIIALNINLNLPKKEIKLLIEHLSEEYSNNKKHNAPYVKASGKNTTYKKDTILTANGKTLNTKILLESSTKLAEMFLIYDLYQKNQSIDNIQLEVNNYKKQTADNHTHIEDYLAMAQYFIDKLHYKDLLT